MIMAIDNKKLVLQHLDLSWNKGEFDKIKDFLSDQFFYKTTFTDEILNGKQYIEFINEFRDAMQDLSVNVELIMSEDNHVMTQISFFGTVGKMIYGIPPGDKLIAFNAISIWETGFDKIISLDTLIDITGLEQQIGINLSPFEPLQSRI